MSEKHTHLVRPSWDYGEIHREKWIEKDITVIICERNTSDILKLCLESLLRFYPDIPILIVEGGSTDDSINYVRYMSITTPNITLWERGGVNAHGIMIDDAIRDHTTTKYVLLFDSDVIVCRGGWIEEILYKMNENDLYAMGTLLFVTNKNDACGQPKDDSDILRYAHPSCSIIQTDLYKTLRPGTNHGAPLVYNMQDAHKAGYKIEYYPIEHYVAHLSGASWCDPKTVWIDDYDICVKPFFTFIVDLPEHILYLKNQTDRDFEIITTGEIGGENIHIYRRDGHGYTKYTPNSNIYPLRFRVHGEYVCNLLSSVKEIDSTFIRIAKQEIIAKGVPEEIQVGGLQLIQRKLWQERDAVL